VKVEVVLPPVHSPPATPMAGVRSAADEGDGRLRSGPAEQQCQNYLLCQFAKYVACLH
jgi:hypothetical protein